MPAFSRRTEYVPNLDDDYRFDPGTMMVTLAGFPHNRRVMIEGYLALGSPRTSCRWPQRLNCWRIHTNLDSHSAHRAGIPPAVVMFRHRIPGAQLSRATLFDPRLLLTERPPETECGFN